MKKFTPFIVALLIPLMTFVIFFFMARNRSFIFSGSFSSEVRAELNGIHSKLTDKIGKNIYSALLVLADKTEIKGAYFTQNTEGSSEILRRVSNTINAYALGSEFVSQIQIVNNNAEIIVTSGRTETGRRKFEEELWNKLSLSDENSLKHVLYKNYYVFAISVNGQGKIVFFVDVNKFASLIPRKRAWLSKNFLFSASTLYFACPSNNFMQSVETHINRQGSALHSDMEFKHSGYIGWGKSISLALRNGKTVKTQMNVFVIGNPKDFPLNFLQRLLLIVNGAIVILLLILLILRIKNENEKSRIVEYHERSNFVFGMLEESTKVLDDSAKTGELSLNEINDIAMTLEHDKMTGSSAGSTGFVQEKDGTVNIPDSAYSKESGANIDNELKELVSEVSRGVDIQHSALKQYWEKVKSVLNFDFNISRFALLEKNTEGVFTVAKSEGLSPLTVERLQFSVFDKFHDKFFKLNKNLYIFKDAFLNKALDEMFDPADKETIGELLLFPVTQENEIIAILCFAREKGLMKIQEELLKNKIIEKSRL